MKKRRKWVLPILLICNLIIFLKNYIGTGDVNLTQLCVIFGLTPIAVKDVIKISNDKKYTYFNGGIGDYCSEFSSQYYLVSNSQSP